VLWRKGLRVSETEQVAVRPAIALLILHRLVREIAGFTFHVPTRDGVTQTATPATHRVHVFGEVEQVRADTADLVEVLEGQRRFLESPWAARTPDTVEVAVETPVGDVVVRGRIDAVFPREGGGWDVVDWKTGSPPDAAASASRAVQLAVYRLAWSLLHGVPLDQVSAAFFYAATGETVRPVDLLDEVGLRALIEAAVSL